MRLFILPAALLAAFCFYLACPQADGVFLAPLHALYGKTRRLCAAKDGSIDEPFALSMFLFLVLLIPSALGALHPIVSVLLLAPTCSAPAVIRAAGKAKRDLDAGVYANNIPVYEALVRDTCSALAPAFVLHGCAPLLLAAVGMPLYMGCGLAWCFLALQAVKDELSQAGKLFAGLSKIADKALTGLFLLSCGLVGRNPLLTLGRGAQNRLLSILGIQQDETETHAPVAGDISQAVFLCIFCLVLLCLLVSLVIFPVV